MIQVKRRAFTKLVAATAIIAAPIMSNGIDNIVIAQQKFIDGCLHNTHTGDVLNNSTTNRVQLKPVETKMTIHMANEEAVVNDGATKKVVPKDGFAALTGHELVYGGKMVEVPSAHQKDFLIRVTSKDGYTPIKVYRDANVESEVKGSFDVPKELEVVDKVLYNNRFFKVKDDLGKYWYIDSTDVNVNVVTNKTFRVTSGNEVTTRERSWSLDLQTRTGMTASEVRTLIEGTSLEGIEDAVVAIEDMYGINAYFTIALAGLESGWGSSYLGRTRNNLFGICAYDGNEGAATYFDTKADCVMYWGKLIHDEYFLNGRTNLESINAIYASNPEWASMVRSLMSRMTGVV